jgi:hypothetical protein
MPSDDVVRCGVYVRTPTAGGCHYDKVHISSPAGTGDLPTSHPPAAGDLIWCWDSITEQGAVYEVVTRQWMHVQYGSHYWPYGESGARVGPELTLIVEPVQGAFRDEVERPEEADEDPEATDG